LAHPGGHRRFDRRDLDLAMARRNVAATENGSSNDDALRLTDIGFELLRLAA
jgi:hypothetical protein